MQLNAQYPIEILGLKLVIELNDADKTAAICNYDAIINDVPDSYTRKVNKTKVTKFLKGAPYTLIIPSEYEGPYGTKYTITTIGEGAFAGVQNVKYISVPPTIKKIGKYAFFGSSLVSVNLPASVMTIGERAFGYCKNLRNLRIPAHVTISQELFAESKKLQVNKYHVSNNGDNAPNQMTIPSGNLQPETEKVLADVDTHIPYGGIGTNDKTFAVIIANENYGQDVPRVEYALNDGRTFKTYCQRVLGIPNENIKLVENATFGQMTKDGISTKKSKRLRTIGWVGGSILVAGGVFLDAYATSNDISEEEILPYNVILLGTGVVWTAGFLISAHITNKKKGFANINSTPLFQKEFILKNGSSLVTGVDLLNDSRIHSQTLGIGLRYQF